MPTHPAVSPTPPSQVTLALLTDDRVVELLRLRPDLASPPTRNFAELTARASSAHSLIACWESLDRFTLQVIEALCLLPAELRSVVGVATLLGGGVTHSEVAEAVNGLRARALVAVQPGPLHLDQAIVRMHPRPAGLGRPLAVLAGQLQAAQIARIAATLGLFAGSSPAQTHAERTRRVTLRLIAEHLSSPSHVHQLLQSAPEEARLLLHRLAREGDPLLAGVQGYQRSRLPWLAWLAERGLLVAPFDWDVFEAPREVCLALRNGRPFARVSVTAPALRTVAVDAVAVETAAAHAAERAIRFVERVVSSWGASPPRQLQSQGGGLRVNDLRRAAQVGEMDEADASRLIEIALSAELIGHHGTETVQPTKRFDAWLAAEPAERWLWLVRAWRESARHHSVHGLRDRRDKAMATLMRFYAEPRAAVQRRSLLEALAAVPPGSAMADAASAVEHVTWACPASWAASYRSAAGTIDALMSEATLLGAAAHLSLSHAGRLALGPDGDDVLAGQAAAALFPAPAKELSLQADLTAVAVGTLEPAMRIALEDIADIESRGAASVFRFSEASLRRALDRGRTAGDIMDFLAAHARHGVPQPLAYLITDVAARHGRLRGRPVLCYITSDDEALVAEVATSRRIRGQPLRRIAPTVLVSDEPLSHVIARLRDAGFMPVAEAANGVAITERVVQRRLPDPQRARSHDASPPRALPTAQLRDMVKRLRAAGGTPAKVLSLYADEDISDIMDVDFIDDDDELNAMAELALVGELSDGRPPPRTSAPVTTRRRGRRRRR